MIESGEEQLLIGAGEVHEYALHVANQIPFVISWECAFKDVKRGTVLKISTDYMYFQFTAPGKDFGTEYDPKMVIYRNTTTICYSDKDIFVVAFAIVARTSTCVAALLDKPTCRLYSLRSSN